MKIFLSVPFSSRVDADGNVEHDYRHAIEKLLASLRERGHHVYCALEYSAWKLGGTTTAAEEFRRDFSEIDVADKLIVLQEERASAGVQLECGYAYAKHKLIETYQLGETTWTNRTFAEVNGHDITVVEGVEDFATKAVEHN